MTRTLPLSPDREALLYGPGAGPLHLIRLWLAGLLRRPAGWRRRMRERREVLGLGVADDHLLSDIGLSRADVLRMIDCPARRRRPGIRLDRPG